MPRIIKKKTKKRTSAAEPEVIDIISDLKSTLKERQQNVIRYGALGGAVLLIIAVFFIYRYNAINRAGQLEYEAYKIYHSLYQKAPLPEQERLQKSLDLFKEAYSKKATPRVLLYIANVSFDQGNYDESLSALNDFIQKYSAAKDLLPLAYQKMALAQMKKGNSAEALKTLDILYKSDSPMNKDLALIESGRILEKEGKKEESEAKYRELTEKYPESPFRAEALGKLGEKPETVEQK